MGDSKGVEELQELLELGVLGLIKGTFQKEGILGAPKKKEIVIGHGLVKLGVKLLRLLFAEFMAAGVKACSIKGTHECGNEIDDTVW